MKVNINNLLDSLYEYQTGEMDDNAKMYLKDELLDLNEQLHTEDITEGRYYEEMMILVQPGAELPQPFKEFTFKSPLTEKEVKLKVKEITALRHNNEGSLIVEVLAQRIKS